MPIAPLPWECPGGRGKEPAPRHRRLPGRMCLPRGYALRHTRQGAHFDPQTRVTQSPAPTTRFKLLPRLREARSRTGRSGSDVAREARLKPTHVSALELGYRDATWPEVELLARILKVDAGWLANREPAAARAPVATTSPSPAPPAEPPAIRTEVREPKTAPDANPRPPRPSAPANVPAPPPPPVPPDTPPSEVPSRTSENVHAYRQLLAAELSRAQTMMAKSGLPARSWVAWRSYQQRIRDALLATSGV